jgi:hypothetical protein
MAAAAAIRPVTARSSRRPRASSSGDDSPAQQPRHRLSGHRRHDERHEQAPSEIGCYPNRQRRTIGHEHGARRWRAASQAIAVAAIQRPDPARRGRKTSHCATPIEQRSTGARGAMTSATSQTGAPASNMVEGSIPIAQASAAAADVAAVQLARMPGSSPSSADPCPNPSTAPSPAPASTITAKNGNAGIPNCRAASPASAHEEHGAVCH